MTDNRSATIPVVQIHDTAVTVNGIEISEFAIQEEARNYEDQDKNKAKERAAAALVIRHLLLEEAQKIGIDQDQGDEKAIEDLLAKKISLPDASDEMRKNYFEKNRENFRSPDLFEVSHILLAAAPDDLELREQLRAQSEQYIQQLQATPEIFAELAKQYSACPSKEVGGNLGQITNGTTVPEFERQLFTLPEGLHNQAIESRYGYHIVRVDRKIEGRPLEFSMVSESIAAHLYRHSQKQAVSGYIEDLVKRAKVKGVDMQAVRAAPTV